MCCCSCSLKQVIEALPINKHSEIVIDSTERRGCSRVPETGCPVHSKLIINFPTPLPLRYNAMTGQHMCLSSGVQREYWEALSGSLSTRKCNPLPCPHPCGSHLLLIKDRLEWRTTQADIEILTWSSSFYLSPATTCVAPVCVFKHMHLIWWRYGHLIALWPAYQWLPKCSLLIGCSWNMHFCPPSHWGIVTVFNLTGLPQSINSQLPCCLFPMPEGLVICGIRTQLTPLMFYCPKNKIKMSNILTLERVLGRVGESQNHLLWNSGGEPLLGSYSHMKELFNWTCPEHIKLPA